MTPRQAEVIAKYREIGSLRKTAEALGVNRRSVERIVARAARALPDLHAKKAPPGYHLRGVSTLLDADGAPVQTWVKTATTHDPESVVRAIRDAIEVANVPAHVPTAVPKNTAKGVLNVLPIGDPHFGMLAWGRESGADWDLKIASEVHRDAIERVFAKAPPAECACVVWMGDSAHANDQSNATPRGQHRLDVDSRWERMLAILFAGMIHSVNAALRSHRTVIVRFVKGNHDPEVTAALALGAQAYFRNEPRVRVEREPTPLFVLEWGKVLLVFAHGHDPKPERIADILSADYREETGRTEQTIVYTGHVHSKVLRERGGIIFEAVQTLAPRDAYATHAGYRSARGIFLDTYNDHDTVATDRASVRPRRVS